MYSGVNSVDNKTQNDQWTMRARFLHEPMAHDRRTISGDILAAFLRSLRRRATVVGGVETPLGVAAKTTRTGCNRNEAAQTIWRCVRWCGTHHIVVRFWGLRGVGRHGMHQCGMRTMATQRQGILLSHSKARLPPRSYQTLRWCGPTHSGVCTGF